jgi:hypothetical protein
VDELEELELEFEEVLDLLDEDFELELDELEETDERDEELELEELLDEELDDANELIEALEDELEDFDELATDMELALDALLDDVLTKLLTEDELEERLLLIEEDEDSPTLELETPTDELDVPLPTGLPEHALSARVMQSARQCLIDMGEYIAGSPD